MAIFTDSIFVWSFWPYCPELPRPFSPTVSLVVESASIWNMEYIYLRLVMCLRRKRVLANQKKKNKKHYSVSVSSGSAEREHRGRAMSVLVNKRGQDQQREQPPIRRLGGAGGGGWFFFFFIRETFTLAEDN